MSGISVYRKGAPTYSPPTGVVLKGGQLVEGTATPGRVQPAGAGSTLYLGVARTDCIAPEDVNGLPTTGPDGRPVTALYSAPTTVSLVTNGEECRVTYAANAAFGQRLVAAANGQVTPAGAAPDARQIVGICTEPGGVVVATNPVGLFRSA